MRVDRHDALTLSLELASVKGAASGLRKTKLPRTNKMMSDDLNAELARWAVAQFDASNRVTEILAQVPLPDGALHAWSLETLRWANSAADAIKAARAKLGEAPPASAPLEVAAALSATARASQSLLDLHDAFVTKLRSAATEIAIGRATEITEAAADSIENIPWLLLESQRVKFMAGGSGLAENDFTRWLLLSRAHAYAIRRDLEDLERQAEWGEWIESDAVAVVVELAALRDAISKGRSLVEVKLQDPVALAEHPSAGDLIGSCGQSFATLETLWLTWSGIFAETSAPASDDDRYHAIEDACAAFSRADAELDRQLAQRAEIMRAMR